MLLFGHVFITLLDEKVQLLGTLGTHPQLQLTLIVKLDVFEGATVDELAEDVLLDVGAHLAELGLGELHLGQLPVLDAVLTPAVEAAGWVGGHRRRVELVGLGLEVLLEVAVVGCGVELLLVGLAVLADEDSPAERLELLQVAGRLEMAIPVPLPVGGIVAVRTLELFGLGARHVTPSGGSVKMTTGMSLVVTKFVPGMMTHHSRLRNFPAPGNRRRVLHPSQSLFPSSVQGAYPKC